MWTISGYCSQLVNANLPLNTNKSLAAVYFLFTVSIKLIQLVLKITKSYRIHAHKAAQNGEQENHGQVHETLRILLQ